MLGRVLCALRIQFWKEPVFVFLKDLQIYEKPPLVACCAARGGGIFGARADEIVSSVRSGWKYAVQIPFSQPPAI